VVQSNLVEGVLKSHAALNFVCPDHGLEYVSDLEDLAIAKIASVLVCAGDPVGGREDSAQVVGGVTPLSSEPAVIKVEPSDHGTNVERSVDRVELVRSTGDLGTVGDDSALDDRSKEVLALLELESLETTTKSVNKDPSCSVELYKLNVSYWANSSFQIFVPRAPSQ
jgi:hypothetical protein